MKEGFYGSRILVLPGMVAELLKEDVLLSGLHVTDIGYFPHAAHHEVKREKGIEQYVFIYCVEGQGNIQIEEEAGQWRSFDLHTDQYCILPIGKAHSYVADKDDPWTIYWIHFAGSEAPVYAEGLDRAQTIRAGINSRIGTRNNMFEEIYNVLKEGYTLENLRYASSLLHYYLGSLHYVHQFRNARSRDKKADESDIVNASIHYMQENIEKRLTLAEIAAYTGFSVSYFSAIFRKKTKHSPLAYFNILKVKEAKHLLNETDMHINQICFKVGIEDNYYFSRLFTKTVGISPTKYRKMAKG